MPSSETVLGRLMRQEPATDAELIILIEEWVKLLGATLKTTTLPKLSDTPGLECDNRWDRPISCFVNETEGDCRFSLETQGIFHAVYASRKDGRLRVWGLARDKKWIVATVEYERRSGWRDRGEEAATRIEVQWVTLPEMLAICQVKPADILRALERFLKDRISIADARLSGLRDIAERFAFDRRVLDLAPTETKS